MLNKHLLVVPHRLGRMELFDVGLATRQVPVAMFRVVVFEYHVVHICDLVAPEIISEVRRICPHCLIAFVYAGEPQEEPLADVSLDVTRGNDPLVHWLEDRLPRDRSSAA